MMHAAEDEIKFDHYVEVFAILEWDEGSVFKTESRGCAWINEDDINTNIPPLSGIIYAAATDNYAMSNTTIRVHREG